jgi:hypothetical protein
MLLYHCRVTVTVFIEYTTAKIDKPIKDTVVV